MTDKSRVVQILDYSWTNNIHTTNYIGYTYLKTRKAPVYAVHLKPVRYDGTVPF
jgi:hypothetical protein